MTSITLYHNPRCSTCRKTEELLAGRKVTLNLVRYLEQPPDRQTLGDLLAILVDPPAALLRSADKQFLEAGLDPKHDYSAAEVLEILLKYPALMQRPVAVRGRKALIARPPERALTLLD